MTKTKMGLKRKNAGLIIGSIFLIILTMGCTRSNKKWWDYSENWFSNDEKVRLYYSCDKYDWFISFGEGDAEKTFSIARWNDGSKILISLDSIDAGSSSVSSKTKDIIAETKYANGKLYVSMEKSDELGVDGTTYILNPVENNDANEQKK